MTPEERAERLVRAERGSYGYRIGAVVDEWKAAIAAAIREAEAAAFRRGAEAMREAAVRECVVLVAEFGSHMSCPERIRALPIPTEGEKP